MEYRLVEVAAGDGMSTEGMKKCFVICPIGAAGSNVRSWSDDLFENVIKPTMADLGYDARRAIDDSRPGHIGFAIFNDIEGADLILCDITDRNPNVFFELALAYVWGRPVILIKGDDLDIPFDINNQNVIPLELGKFSSGARAASDLRAQVKAFEKHGAIDNPINQFGNLKKVSASEDPEKALLIQLIARVDSLEAQIRSESLRVAASTENPSNYGLFGDHHITIQRKLPRSAFGLLEPYLVVSDTPPEGSAK